MRSVVAAVALAVSVFLALDVFAGPPPVLILPGLGTARTPTDNIPLDVKIPRQFDPQFNWLSTPDQTLVFSFDQPSLNSIDLVLNFIALAPGRGPMVKQALAELKSGQLKIEWVSQKRLDELAGEGSQAGFIANEDDTKTIFLLENDKIGQLILPLHHELAHSQDPVRAKNDAAFKVFIRQQMQEFREARRAALKSQQANSPSPIDPRYFELFDRLSDAQFEQSPYWRRVKLAADRMTLATEMYAWSQDFLFSWQIPGPLRNTLFKFFWMECKSGRPTYFPYSLPDETKMASMYDLDPAVLLPEQSPLPDMDCPASLISGTQEWIGKE